MKVQTGVHEDYSQTRGIGGAGNREKMLKNRKKKRKREEKINRGTETGVLGLMGGEVTA